MMDFIGIFLRFSAFTLTLDLVPECSIFDARHGAYFEGRRAYGGMVGENKENYAGQKLRKYGFTCRCE